MPRDEDLFPDPLQRPMLARPGSNTVRGGLLARGREAARNAPPRGNPQGLLARGREAAGAPAYDPMPPPVQGGVVDQSNAYGGPAPPAYAPIPPPVITTQPAGLYPQRTTDKLRGLGQFTRTVYDGTRDTTSHAIEGVIGAAGAARDAVGAGRDAFGQGFRGEQPPPALPPPGRTAPPPAVDTGPHPPEFSTSRLDNAVELRQVPPAPAPPGSAAPPGQGSATRLYQTLPMPGSPQLFDTPPGGAIGGQNLQTMGTRTAEEQARIDQAVAGIDAQTEAKRGHKEWMKDYRSRQKTGMTREELKDRNLENRIRLNERAPDPTAMSLGQVMAQKARNRLAQQQRGELAGRQQTRAAERIATQQAEAEQKKASAETARQDRQFTLDARRQQVDEEKAYWDIRLAVEELQSKDADRAAKLDPFAKLGAEMVMAEVEKATEAAAQFGESVTPEQMDAAMERGRAYEAYARRQAGYFRSDDGQLWGPEQIRAAIEADPEVETVEDLAAKYNLR